MPKTNYSIPSSSKTNYSVSHGNNPITRVLQSGETRTTQKGITRVVESNNPKKTNYTLEVAG